MSANIYVTEPMTTGKVVLHTTVGALDIELWSKEIPKATRNFVQYVWKVIMIIPYSIVL